MSAACWLGRGLHLDPSTKIRKKLEFEAPASISSIVANDLKVGAWSYIQRGGRLAGKVVIGRYCSIGEYLNTCPPDHPTHWLSTSTSFYQRSQFNFWMSADLSLLKKEVLGRRPPLVVVGNDVWIGRNVMIMRGITVGDGAIIAAGAVVTKDVPPYTVVGGVPAKMIKQRYNPELVDRLLESQWWQYDRQDLDGIPANDPDAALDEIARRVEEGKLRPRPVSYQVYAQEQSDLS